MQTTFMTLKEAAAYLKLPRSTLYKYTHKKLIPHYKPNGKLLYFKKEDLDNFVGSNLIEAEDRNGQQ